MCDRIFYFEKIKLNHWIILIQGISIFWSGSLRIRFWNFLRIFENTVFIIALRTWISKFLLHQKFRLEILGGVLANRFVLACLPGKISSKKTLQALICLQTTQLLTKNLRIRSNFETLRNFQNWAFGLHLIS